MRNEDETVSCHPPGPPALSLIDARRSPIRHIRRWPYKSDMPNKPLAAVADYLSVSPPVSVGVPQLGRRSVRHKDEE